MFQVDKNIQSTLLIYLGSQNVNIQNYLCLIIIRFPIVNTCDSKFFL